MCKITRFSDFRPPAGLVVGPALGASLEGSVLGGSRAAGAGVGGGGGGGMGLRPSATPGERGPLSLFPRPPPPDPRQPVTQTTWHWPPVIQSPNTPPPQSPSFGCCLWTQVIAVRLTLRCCGLCTSLTPPPPPALCVWPGGFLSGGGHGGGGSGMECFHCNASATVAVQHTTFRHGNAGHFGAGISLLHGTCATWAVFVILCQLVLGPALQRLLAALRTHPRADRGVPWGRGGGLGFMMTFDPGDRAAQSVAPRQPVHRTCTAFHAPPVRCSERRLRHATADLFSLTSDVHTLLCLTVHCRAHASVSPGGVAVQISVSDTTKQPAVPPGHCRRSRRLLWCSVPPSHVPELHT